MKETSLKLTDKIQYLKKEWIKITLFFFYHLYLQLRATRYGFQKMQTFMKGKSKTKVVKTQKRLNKSIVP